MNTAQRAAKAVNQKVGSSSFGHVFRLEGSRHDKEIKDTKFTTEIRAGLTTFFTMAYIIAVNASILSETGGNCVCDGSSNDPTCRIDAIYLDCVRDLRRSLITATAAIAGFSSFLFGVLTNMPVCLAPGMGLNAYFAYQIVGFHGAGPISYNLALTAVFIEGFIFIALSLIGMRQWLVKTIPASLKIACACGIGLYLAQVGLSYSAGIGAISGSRTTPLQIAGCPEEFRDDDGFCTSHKMTSPTMWIGIMCGGVITAYLMTFKVKSAMIAGIALVSIMSWPRRTRFTYFPDTVAGDDRWSFFKKVVYFHPIDQTLNTLDWDVTKAPAQFALALFTFLYVDIIDCTATLYSMARFCGVVDPETGDFPRSTLAYCTDAFSISVGALLGCSPVTTFVESGAGIAEGGKTGLTAMVCGICFFISMFFAPIFASIPPWATGCTLILVGCLMMRQVVGINWKYTGDAIPAFVTIMFIPFGYSAAYGLIAGLMSYAALNGFVWVTKVVTRGRVVPDDEDEREYWTIKPHGRLPWFIRSTKTLTSRVGSHHSNQYAESIRSVDTRDISHGNSRAVDQELDVITVAPEVEKTTTRP